MDREILVLRNGQILEGRISQAQGQYVVDVGDGQIRVKPADVDVICQNLEEGYRRKRAETELGNFHHHLELSQWCLQHGLLGPAAAELADAAAIQPNHPMLGVMRQRIKLALEPPAAPDATPVRRVGPSNDDLDRMIHSLPHGAVETFTQSVQPVLMNHCATGGCHGPQSENALRLFRVTIGKSASRRITQRNLYTVLPFIDRDNPANSRLLTATSGPHGTVKHAIFAEHEVGQFQRLAEWAWQLSQQPLPEVPATLNAMASEIGESAGMPTPPQLLSHEAVKSHPLAPEHNSNVKRGAGTRADAGKTAPASFNQAADPYDPEFFNSRYAAEREKQQKKETAEPGK